MFSGDRDTHLAVFIPDSVFKDGELGAERGVDAWGWHPAVKEGFHYAASFDGNFAGAATVVPFSVWDGVAEVFLGWDRVVVKL